MEPVFIELSQLTFALFFFIVAEKQVNFLPLDIRDEEDIALVLQHADYIVQYGEDLEPKQPKDDVSLDRDQIVLGGRGCKCEQKPNWENKV